MKKIIGCYYYLEIKSEGSFCFVFIMISLVKI